MSSIRNCPFIQTGLLPCLLKFPHFGTCTQLVAVLSFLKQDKYQLVWLTFDYISFLTSWVTQTQFLEEETLFQMTKLWNLEYVQAMQMQKQDGFQKPVVE